MIEEMLLCNGIPIYQQTFFTDLPATAMQQNPIAQTLPTQIGYIYGLSLYTDTVGPTNQTLININDCRNMYLQLNWKGSKFMDSIRLSDLCYDVIPFGTALCPEPRYKRVSIPYNFSMDQSYYLNPKNVVSKTVALNLWYITRSDYNKLITRGEISDDLIPIK